MKQVKNKIESLQEDVVILSGLRSEREELIIRLTEINQTYNDLVPLMIINANSLANVFSYDLSDYSLHFMKNITETEGMLSEYSNLINHLNNLVLANELEKGLSVNMIDKKVSKI